MEVHLKASWHLRTIVLFFFVNAFWSALELPIDLTLNCGTQEYKRNNQKMLVSQQEVACVLGTLRVSHQASVDSDHIPSGEDESEDQSHQPQTV